MAVNAIVLAGSANNGPLKDVSPASNEALIDIGGKPMVQYVIDGLNQAKSVGRIVIVAPPGQVEPCVLGDRLQFVPSGNSIVENIQAASRVLPEDEKILIATSDIPLITGPIVDSFIAQCLENDGDLHYPVVEKSVNEQKYPLVQRTYIHLKEGIYTGGNLFLLNPWIVEPCAPKVEKFVAYRKNPIKLAGLLGWPFVFRFFTKSLSLKELEIKVSGLWGVKGRVIICPCPEIGIDVDKPSDLQLARAALL